MKGKLWILFLGFALSFVPLGPQARAGQTKQAKMAEQSKLAEQTAKIKTEISKRVTGQKTRVKLKLRSGAEMKGRLNQAGNDDFTFTNEKGGQQVTITYADVERVKGRGLSTGAKFGIIAAVAVTAVVIAGVLSFRNFDPFRGGLILR